VRTLHAHHALIAEPQQTTCQQPTNTHTHTTRFLEVTFFPWLFIVKPYLTYQAGGMELVCWSIAVPMVLGWHSTFLVNSAAHTWGTRPYDTGAWPAVRRCSWRRVQGWRWCLGQRCEGVWRRTSRCLLVCVCTARCRR
jgi:fatty-acid desaturase